MIIFIQNSLLNPKIFLRKYKALCQLKEKINIIKFECMGILGKETNYQ